MQIHIRDKKTQKRINEVKAIEQIKCNSKLLAFLLDEYEEKIQMQRELCKMKKAG